MRFSKLSAHYLALRIKLRTNKFAETLLQLASASCPGAFCLARSAIALAQSFEANFYTADKKLFNSVWLTSYVYEHLQTRNLQQEAQLLGLGNK